MKVPLPIVIAREGKWFVASCPLLDIGTQGETEEEVKEMMADLVNDYFKDPDTPKPKMSSLLSISLTLTSIPINLPEGVLNSKASPSASA